MVFATDLQRTRGREITAAGVARNNEGVSTCPGSVDGSNPTSRPVNRLHPRLGPSLS